LRICVQRDAAQALSIAARGGKADTAKPFKGVGSGVFEITLRRRDDAFRVIYALQLGEALCDPRIPEKIEEGDQDAAIGGRSLSARDLSD
jgi:Phage derived protein Gp49-like (DUF891)